MNRSLHSNSMFVRHHRQLFDFARNRFSTSRKKSMFARGAIAFRFSDFRRRDDVQAPLIFLGMLRIRSRIVSPSPHQWRECDCHAGVNSGITSLPDFGLDIPKLSNVYISVNFISPPAVLDPLKIYLRLPSKFEYLNG